MKYLSILTFALGFLVTLLSAERTGTILYLITILFFIFYIKGYSKFKIMVLIFSLISIIFIFNTNNQKQRLFINSLQNIQNGKVWISVMHDAHMRTSLNMFLQNPILELDQKCLDIIVLKKGMKSKTLLITNQMILDAAHILTTCSYKQWQKQE